MAEIISQLMVAVDRAAKLDRCQIGLAMEINYFMDRALVVRDDEVTVVVFVHCGDVFFRRLLMFSVRLMQEPYASADSPQVRLDILPHEDLAMQQ